MKRVLTALLLVFTASISLAQETEFNAFDVSGLSERVTKAEKDILDIKDELASLRKSLISKENCECPNGVCICPDGKCVCPKQLDLFAKPITSSNTQIVKWEGLANNIGRSVEVESAPDCTYCIALLNQLKDVSSNISVKKYDSIQNSPRNSLPYVALKINGETVQYLAYGGCADEIKSFLAGSNSSLKTVPKTNYSSSVQSNYSTPTQSSYSTVKTVVRYPGPTWDVEGGARSYANLTRHLPEHGFSDFSGLSVSQLATIHDNFHNAGTSGVSYSQSPRIGRVTTPSRSYNYPIQIQRPMTNYLYCPTCVR